MKSSHSVHVRLLTLGLDSAFAWLETLVGYITDYLEESGNAAETNDKKVPPTWKVTCAVASAIFLCGIPFTTRLGLELIDMVDRYVGVLFLLFVVFLESIMLNVDVGWRRLAWALSTATSTTSSSQNNINNGQTLFPKWLCRLDFHFTC
mgnify:CR=1 FL=1